MMVRVLLFGPQAIAAGRDEVTVEVESPSTCAAIRARLEAEYPVLRSGLASSRLAVNREFAQPGRTVNAGDEVALIGLVSGG